MDGNKDGLGQNMDEGSWVFHFSHPESKKGYVKILKIAIEALSLSLNEFVAECKDEDGKPKQPSYRALMKASGCLPLYCSETLIKPKLRNEKMLKKENENE